MTELFQDIPAFFYDSFIAKTSFARSFRSAADSLKRLPLVTSYQPRGCTTRVHSIAEYIVRHFNSVEKCKRMKFKPDDSSVTDRSKKMTHYVQCKHYIHLTGKLDKGVHAIVVQIFYDDFRKFRTVAGSAGGFYFRIMNSDRESNSKPENIYQIAIVNSDDDFITVLMSVIRQLQELNGVKRIYHAGLGQYISVQLCIGMFLADMPERHKQMFMQSFCSDNGYC